MIRGDRQSLGYKKSDPDFNFTPHTIPIENRSSFYLSSDGFWDQMRKDETSRFGFRTFGKNRFAKLLGKIDALPFDARKKELLDVFHAHQKDMPRQDDVTIVGFRLTLEN